MTAATARSSEPCTIASATDAGKVLGVASAPAGAARPATQPRSRCVGTFRSARLKITVGPKAEASGGSGGPAGMKTVTPTGLGSMASEAYDHSTQFNVTSITFVKGPYWLSPWGNGCVPTALATAYASAAARRRIAYAAATTSRTSSP